MGQYVSVATEFFFPNPPRIEPIPPLACVAQRNAIFGSVLTDVLATLPVWGPKSKPRSTRFKAKWVYSCEEDAMKLLFDHPLPPKFIFLATWKAGEPARAKITTPFLDREWHAVAEGGAEKTTFVFNEEMFVSVLTLPCQNLRD